MKQIAMVLLFDRHDRLLIYLRDDKPEIPFPNHWDFFGGHLEEGETPEQAMIREVKEELGIDLHKWNFFREYICSEGAAYPNIKYLYWAKTGTRAEELTLYEGQRLMSITADQRRNLKVANSPGQLIADLVARRLPPPPADDSW